MRNRFLGGLIPALLLAALPALSSAGVFVGVSVNLAPPPLPVYVQPPCPEPGYIWTPGYWAWNDGAYYWVPGTWVLPPRVGLLWTPGYWGWSGGAYIWHAGYWGPHVGFYGGVDYGFGYDGAGFVGGYWRGGVFFYNRAVVHVGPTFVRNVYYHPVVRRTTYEHVSFNGGPRGVRAHASREQIAAAHERHVAFTPVQQRQQRMAFADRSLRADYNHGRPPVAATARPTVFHGNGAFAARAAGGPMHDTRTRPTAMHADGMRSDRPSWASGQNHAGRPMERPTQHPMAHPAHPMERPRQHPMMRGAPMHEQHRFERQPAQPRFEPRPQPSLERRGSRPTEHPQPRSQPQPRPEPQRNFRPQERGPAARGPEPHAQQRGGGERPHRPPENRGGGHGRQ